MDDIFMLEKGEAFERRDVLSTSELEKLEVDENLSEIDRSIYLLDHGVEIQKTSVLENLTKIILRDGTKEGFCIIFTKLKTIIMDSEEHPELATKSLESIFALINSNNNGLIINNIVEKGEMHIVDIMVGIEEKEEIEGLLSPEIINEEVLPYLLELAGELEESNQKDIVSKCIISTLSRISKPIKGTEIIEFAIRKGDVSQSVDDRLICCKIIGEILSLNQLCEEDVIELFLQKMISLCQDTDADVRRCMCEQLGKLARRVSSDVLNQDLLPEILELLEDEEPQVVSTAFVCVISLFELFNEVERKSRLLPSILNLMKHPPDYFVEILAKGIGVLAYKFSLTGDFSNDIVSIFSQSFSNLTRNSNSDVRRFCAFNLPAVLKAVGPSRYSTQLDEILQRSSLDDDVKVRMTVAAGIHEIAQLLGSQRVLRYVKSVTFNLLNDDALEVPSMVISNLPTILRHFSGISDAEQKMLLMESFLSSTVTHSEKIPASRWRYQITLLKSLYSFPDWFASAQIYERISPILWKYMLETSRPVQTLASHTLIWVLRNNNNEHQRQQIIHKIRRDLGNGKGCWQRCLYLDICESVLLIFSQRYFKQNFLEIGLDMLEDRVPNVRMRAIAMLPRWRCSLKYPGDTRLLDRIKRYLDKSSNESDRDVSNTLICIQEKLREYEEHGYSIIDDTEDQRRMEEEDKKSMRFDGEYTTVDTSMFDGLDYTTGKDGNGLRRSRVKSLDLAKNKIGNKDTNRNKRPIGSQKNPPQLPLVPTAKNKSPNEKHLISPKGSAVRSSTHASNKSSNKDSSGNTKIPNIVVPTRPTIPSPHHPHNGIKTSGTHRPRSENVEHRTTKDSRVRVAPMHKR